MPGLPVRVASIALGFSGSLVFHNPRNTCVLGCFAGLCFSHRFSFCCCLFLSGLCFEANTLLQLQAIPFGTTRFTSFDN